MSGYDKGRYTLCDVEARAVKPRESFEETEFKF